jgi:hypothetical protein
MHRLLRWARRGRKPPTETYTPVVPVRDYSGEIGQQILADTRMRDNLGFKPDVTKRVTDNFMRRTFSIPMVFNGREMQVEKGVGFDPRIENFTGLSIPAFSETKIVRLEGKWVFKEIYYASDNPWLRIMFILNDKVFYEISPGEIHTKEAYEIDDAFIRCWVWDPAAKSYGLQIKMDIKSRESMEFWLKEMMGNDTFVRVGFLLCYNLNF